MSKLINSSTGYITFTDVVIQSAGEQEYLATELDFKAPAQCVGTDGIVSVTRLKQDVITDEVASSFENTPITINHPFDAVSINNWAQYARGVCTNVRAKGDTLTADLVFYDNEAVTAYENGIKEVSAGYSCDHELREDNKLYQINVVGNHVALVEKGRCGETCSIKDGIPPTDNSGRNVPKSKPAVTRKGVVLSSYYEEYLNEKEKDSKIKEYWLWLLDKLKSIIRDTKIKEVEDMALFFGGAKNKTCDSASTGTEDHTPEQMTQLNETLSKIMSRLDKLEGGSSVTDEVPETLEDESVVEVEDEDVVKVTDEDVVEIEDDDIFEVSDSSIEETEDEDIEENLTKDCAISKQTFSNIRLFSPSLTRDKAANMSPCAAKRQAMRNAFNDAAITQQLSDLFTLEEVLKNKLVLDAALTVAAKLKRRVNNDVTKTQLTLDLQPRQIASAVADINKLNQEFYANKNNGGR